MRNLKLAFRTLLRTPFVMAVAIVSLALGIGANAAIYSMFEQILLRPLPVPHAERLVKLAVPGPQGGWTSCNQSGDCDEVLSYPMFRDLERAKPAGTTLAAHVIFGANVAMSGQTPVATQAEFVSGSYFPVLGIRPALGRLLSPFDDQTIGGHYVAVVSYGFWQTQLGARPDVINQQISINGKPMTVVGVAPPGFFGTTIGAQPAVFLPLTMRAAINRRWDNFEDRRGYWLYVFGRLAPGTSLEQAKSALNATYHGIINDVEAPLHTDMSAATLAQFKAKQLKVTDGRQGQSSMIKGARAPLTLLFSITGIVLLIACANIANLLLARAANRTMEMAVRLSLGATRRQLIAQVVTESVLLAVLGGIASLAVAHWTLAGIVAMLPPSGGVEMEFKLGGAVLVFTAAVSLGTGLLFGLAPALQSTRPDLVTELRNNSGKLAGGRRAARVRTTLVTAQIALSMALLIAAGLFIKSLRNVSRVDLGIQIDNMVTFSISPGRNGYDSLRIRQLYERTEEALRAIPGVSGVTSASLQLLAGNNWGRRMSVEGFKKDPDTDVDSRFNTVGAGYFHVLGVPLLSGRDFTVSDNTGAPRVAIVNEAFAKKFNLGRDAVGKHISIDNDSLNLTIVGLSRNAKYSEVKDEIPPVIVIPYLQDEPSGSLTFYVRSALPAAQTIQAMRTVMSKLDPNLPVRELKTMPQQVRENVFLDRMIGTLSSSFALLATLLAAVGLYGVLAYSVAQRTKEIGVRMALGAAAGTVRLMILRQVGLMTLVGGLIGIAGAIALGKGAESLLYQLKGWDPVVMVISIVVLSLVSGAAGLAPALKASRVDPMHALRYE
jgi:putative ABC transport system permease protein